MTEKTAFTPEEQYQLWKAPYTTALAVIAAQPGGLIAEIVATVKSTLEARQQCQTSLLQSILELSQEDANAYSEQVNAEVRQASITGADDVLALAVTGIRAALGILRERAEPDEIQEYRQMILQRAEKVAQAGKEGSFLGIGGVRVSEAEERALAEIRLAANRLS